MHRGGEGAREREGVQEREGESTGLEGGCVQAAERRQSAQERVSRGKQECGPKRAQARAMEGKGESTQGGSGREGGEGAQEGR